MKLSCAVLLIGFVPLTAAAGTRRIILTCASASALAGPRNRLA